MNTSNQTLLKNKKKVIWREELASHNGIDVIVKTQLTKEEKKEFQYEISHERDVTNFIFLKKNSEFW